MKLLREQVMKITIDDNLKTDELIEVVAMLIYDYRCKSSYIYIYLKATALIAALSSDRMQLKAGRLFNVGIRLVPAVIIFSL